MEYVFAWYVFVGTIYARLTLVRNPALKSEFEASSLGAMLDLLGGLSIVGGLVWGFIVLGWQDVLVYFFAGIIAGSFVAEIFRTIDRAIFGFLGNVLVVATVGAMYADYFGWIELKSAMVWFGVSHS